MKKLMATSRILWEGERIAIDRQIIHNGTDAAMFTRLQKRQVFLDQKQSKLEALMEDMTPGMTEFAEKMNAFMDKGKEIVKQADVAS